MRKEERRSSPRLKAGVSAPKVPDEAAHQPLTAPLAYPWVLICRTGLRGHSCAWNAFHSILCAGRLFFLQKQPALPELDSWLTQGGTPCAGLPQRPWYAAQGQDFRPVYAELFCPNECHLPCTGVLAQAWWGFGSFTAEFLPKNWCSHAARPRQIRLPTAARPAAGSYGASLPDKGEGPPRNPNPRNGEFETPAAAAGLNPKGDAKGA